MLHVHLKYYRIYTCNSVFISFLSKGQVDIISVILGEGYCTETNVDCTCSYSNSYTVHISHSRMYTRCVCVCVDGLLCYCIFCLNCFITWIRV